MLKSFIKFISICFFICIGFTYKIQAEITVEFFDSKEYTFSDTDKGVIKAIVQNTEKEIRDYLPQLPEFVLLTVITGSEVIQSTGESCIAMSPGYIRWIVDPFCGKSVVQIAEKNLKVTLFHELHHVVRRWVMYAGNPMNTFMDAVISEGLATVFERDACGADPIWGKYPENVIEWVEELLKLDIMAPYNEWMFKHTDGREFIGYKAGTYIIDRVTKNSGLTSADLVLTPTEEIIKMSGVMQVLNLNPERKQYPDNTDQ